MAGQERERSLSVLLLRREGECQGWQPYSQREFGAGEGTWGTMKPQSGFGEFIAKENTQAISGYSSVVLQHGEILLEQPKYEA